MTQAPDHASGPGAPVTPVEAAQLLRGGRFVADLADSETLRVAFVRSTVAAARIASVDTSMAAAMPGVVAVVTGAELADHVGPIPAGAVPRGVFADRVALQAHPRAVEPLAVDRVHHVGQAVAVVVATDRYLAEDAAGAVEVEYRPLPPVVGVEAALAPGAPLVHQDCPGNVALRLAYTTGVAPSGTGSDGPQPDGTQPDGTGSDGTILVEGTYRVGRQSGMSIECRGVLARPSDGGRIDVWSSTQAPFGVRNAICAACGWPEDRVRVRTPDVGGGFGPKVVPNGEEVVVAFLASMVKKPVLWAEDRYESLVAAPQARDQIHRCRLRVATDGQIVSWEDDFVVDIGAHNPWMVGVAANTALHLLGPYRVPHARITGTAVFTNKAPTSQYRGAGRPEAAFALERSLDQAARRLGMSQWSIRERNILGVEDLPYAPGVPYRDGIDIVYDGSDYRQVLDDARRLLDQDDLEELRRTAGTRRVGVGIGAYMEATARGPAEPETARVALGPQGRIVVHSGTGPSGQSQHTVFAQVVVGETKRAIDDVEVVTGDTDGVSQGLGSFASRSAVIGGSAVLLATRKFLRQVRGAVSGVVGPGRIRLTADGFMVAGRTQIVRWSDIAGWFDPGGPLEGHRIPDAEVTFAPPTVTWTMGVHVAVVTVDPDTGAVAVERYGVAHEAGPSLNPRVVTGQVKGGVAQGIGGAILESVRYDGAGQPLSATMADYLIPSSVDVPTVQVTHREVRTDRNPLGIRGIGESGTIGGYAAIAAAIDDALRPGGTPVTCVPVDPATVLDLAGGSVR